MQSNTSNGGENPHRRDCDVVDDLNLASAILDEFMVREFSDATERDLISLTRDRVAMIRFLSTRVRGLAFDLAERCGGARA